MTTTTSSTEYYDGYYVVTTTTCTDAVPATTGTPAVVQDYSTYGWDAGARSLESFVDNGYILFPSPRNPKGVVIGLNQVNTSPVYTEIEHGFYFTSDQYWIVVDGQKVGAAQPATLDALAVVQTFNGQVYYVYNGSLVYQTPSLFPSDTNIFCDVSLYGPGDGIGCVDLDVGTFIEVPGINLITRSSIEYNGGIQLTTSSSVRAEEYSNTISYFPSPVFTVDSYQYQTYTSSDPSDPQAPQVGVIGVSNTSLPALTSFSTSGLSIPSLTGANTLFPALVGAAYSLTGGIANVDVDLPALDSRASDHLYGESEVTLPMIWSLAVSAPYLSGTMYGELPEFTFQGYATEQPESGLNRVLTSQNFLFTGVMGDQAQMTTPEFTFTGDMTFPSIGRAEIGFGFNVTTSVTVETIATAYLMMRMEATMLSYSGNGLAVLAPKFTATANVISGAVATVYADFAVSADIQASANDYAKAQIIMPEFVSVWGTMYATAPQFTLNVEGSEVVVRPTMAYVSHLSADAEMTAYTGYDFDSVVYFKGHYYGIKSDGMYLLEGADDGGTYINVDVKTQEFDFDTARKKRIPYLYAGSDNVFNVTPFVDGVNFGTYTSTKGEERVYLPQGATGRYWQFEYQNIDGNNFALDSVDIVVNTLRRKV